ncbi:MAG: hypothetical protein DMD31_14735 [Gemmatimonadetes bacterium]|nr:MAG: hypothetical protein DMD31_14735 [Gemmatimonadota bacterium]
MGQLRSYFRAPGSCRPCQAGTPCARYGATASCAGCPAPASSKAMRPVSHTLINSIRAPIERVFALLTDPARIAQWLPGCDGVQSDVPLRKGVRFKARFGGRQTEFEVVDFSPPTTFGWVERGERKGWKTFFRLDASAGATAVTIRDVWTPQGFGAWVRGRFLDKRRVQSQLKAMLDNLGKLLAS